MKTFFLSFPRLSVSLTVSHEIVADIESTFSHSISPARELPSRHKYEIKATSHGFVCLKDNQLVGKFGSSLETLCILEEDIEVSLTRHMGDWVAFHAGAVAAGDFACVVVGDPDTGKTTTTFNLIEMGHMFLCEGVCPVDPETLLVYPYPQVLSMSRAYAEKYLLLNRVKKGEITLFDSDLARYRPFQAAKVPLPLKTILLPAYDPSSTPGVEDLSPGHVLTDLLSYCFPPNTDDEYLFDSVIRICEESELFRIHANNLQSMRQLLKELFDLD